MCFGGRFLAFALRKMETLGSFVVVMATFSSAGLTALRLAIYYAPLSTIGTPESCQQNVKLFLRGP
jgi:hypothetical protein